MLSSGPKLKVSVKLKVSGNIFLTIPICRLQTSHLFPVFTGMTLLPPVIARSMLLFHIIPVLIRRGNQSIQETAGPQGVFAPLLISISAQIEKPIIALRAIPIKPRLSWPRPTEQEKKPAEESVWIDFSAFSVFSVASVAEESALISV